MVLTQVNYYEKLQFMLFIIIMAKYVRFSNTVPKQLELFIRSSLMISFFVWVCTQYSEGNTHSFSLTTRIKQEILITSPVSEGGKWRTNRAYVDVTEVNQQCTKIFIIVKLFSTDLEEILLNLVIWKWLNVSN